VLFRPRSAVARLYSIAVAPHMSGKGVASLLLKRSSGWRGARCTTIRLEVHQTNHAAIARYHKQGYQEFGRHRRYYDDGAMHCGSTKIFSNHTKLAVTMSLGGLTPASESVLMSPAMPECGDAPRFEL